MGVNSNPEPTEAGVHLSMMTPLGRYTTPNRLMGAAAVLTSAVNAGTMPSSSGSATAAPSPRRIVRRGMAFLVTIMSRSSAYETACS